MKSKIEFELNEILKSKFVVKYEPTKLSGSEYLLKVDFSITTTTGQIYYLEYSGMNFLKKYLKIIDILKNHGNVFIIYDDENLEQQIEKFYKFINLNNSNNIMSTDSVERTVKRIDDFYSKFNELKLQ